MAATGTTPYEKSETSTRPIDDKASAAAEVTHVDNKDDLGNLTYDLVDEEPEVHWRTYLATAAMFLLNLVQVVALQGPPIAVGYNASAHLSEPTH